MSRRGLQVVNLGLALLTVALAGASLAFGVASPIYGQESLSDSPALDSNLRFMGGVGVGLGVALVWITPKIEQHTTVFRVVWLCALAGGLGRLISAAFVGVPPLPMLILTIIEVLGVPLLLIWQSRVASSSRNDMS